MTKKIWFFKGLKIEIQKEGLNNAQILQNWFPLEIRSQLSLICRIFKSLTKGFLNHTERIAI